MFPVFTCCSCSSHSSLYALMTHGKRCLDSGLHSDWRCRKSACFLTGWFSWSWWRLRVVALRERRPCIQAADVLRSNSSSVVLVEWRDSGAVRRASPGPGPGAAALIPAHPTCPLPLLLESPDLLQMESPQRQTPHSAAIKDFGMLAEARKTERGV